ncbi:hypothetical protein BDZ88DRAFT_491178 [Geranomyces variabilis]|nr:hypothetical protein BDZ88DRAFT_491178 [Geranomyces variabilis]
MHELACAPRSGMNTAGLHSPIDAPPQSFLLHATSLLCHTHHAHQGSMSYIQVIGSFASNKGTYRAPSGNNLPEYLSISFRPVSKSGEKPGNKILGNPTLHGALSHRPYTALAMVGHIHGLALTAVAELRRVCPPLRCLPKPKARRNRHSHCSILMVESAFPYMESLAAYIGCRVDTRALWWDKPQLWKLVIIGTFCTHHYGWFRPGKWNGAENVIFDVCGLEVAERKRGK